MATLTMSPATVIRCGGCGGAFRAVDDVSVVCVPCSARLSIVADIMPHMEEGERLVTVERDGVSVLAYFVESGE